MTTGRATDRLHDALHELAVPEFPAAALRARVTVAAETPRSSRPALRMRTFRAALTAGIVAIAAIVIAASAATAIPNPMSDAVLRAFDRVGIHLRGAHWVDSPEVSLDQARAAADFAIVIPPNAHVHRINMTKTRGQAYVVVILGYGKSEIALQESHVMRASKRNARARDFGLRVDANGRIHRASPLVWNIGTTHLTTLPYDAPSRAYAESVRRETLAAAAQAATPGPSAPAGQR